MKRLKILICLLLLSTAYVVSAHEIVQNGTVSLLIHIDPDDVAIAGKPTTIHIDLENKDKGFALEKCKCFLNVELDEKDLLSVPIVPATEPSVYSAQGVPFTFPRQGEYHISVKGSPVDKNLFSPFEVEVHENVLPIGADLPSDTTNTMSHMSGTHSHAYPRIELAGAVIFSALMAYFLFGKNKTLARFIIKGSKV